jgi:hypothetical protein
MIARRAYPAALAAIVLLGAALRLFPVWFGLPHAHARPDEETPLSGTPLPSSRAIRIRISSTGRR